MMILLVHIPFFGLLLLILLLSPSSSLVVPTTSTTSKIIIQFDGSFRPPKDPGFVTLSHRLAVCAACIGIQFSHVDKSIPVALGGKILPILPDIMSSSQYAEYEGLLLGLKKFSEMNMTTLLLFFEDDGDDDGDSSSLQKLEILIQGDCKTVIDQLSGKSTPRKLESLHQQARSLIDQIIFNCEREGTIITNVVYQHYARNENYVCDNICNNMINAITSKSWKDCINQLIDERSNESSGFVQDLLSTYLNPSTSKIKYSLRPPLYEKLADISLEIGDYHSLVEIGERLWEEVATYHPRQQLISSIQRYCIELQIKGWKGLGKEKKVTYLERRYRFLLSSSTPPRPSAMNLDSLYHLGIAKEEWDIRISKTWMDPLSRWFTEANAIEDTDDWMIVNKSQS